MIARHTVVLEVNVQDMPLADHRIVRRPDDRGVAKAKTPDPGGQSLKAVIPISPPTAIAVEEGIHALFQAVDDGARGKRAG
jgi:hypothetical protein